MLKSPGYLCLLTVTALFLLINSAHAQAGKDRLAELVAQLSVPDTAQRAAAIRELGLMGTAAKPAVPALIRAANGQDPYLAREANLAVNNIGIPEGDEVRDFIRILKSGDESEQIDVLNLLRASTTIDAKMAIAEFSRSRLDFLIDKVKNSTIEEDRRMAIYFIGAIWQDGAPAVPALVGALKDKNPEIREVALAVLGRIGPGSAAAVPALTDVLEGDFEYAMCKQCAAYALGRIKSPEAIPALMKGLSSGEPEVTLTSFKSLAGFGEAADGAIPEMEKVALREDILNESAQRKLIIDALRGMGTPASAALLARVQEQESAPVWKLLEDKNIHYGNTVEPIITRIGDSGKAAVPHLLEALSSDDEKTVTRALWALGKLAPHLKDKPEPLIKAIRPLLSSPRSDVRKSAAYLSGEMGPAAAECTDLLAAHVESGDDCKGCALEALGKIGTPKSIEVITKATGSPDRDVSLAAIMIISRVKDTDPPSVAALLNPFTSSPDAAFRGQASAAAFNARLGGLMKGLPLLLRDSVPDIQSNAALALGTGSSLDSESEAELIRMLDSSVPAVQINAAYALANAGSPAVMPRLKRILDGYTDHRQMINAIYGILRLEGSGSGSTEAVISAFDRLGVTERRDAVIRLSEAPPPVSSYPLLEHALKDADFWVRILAGECVAAHYIAPLSDRAADALFSIGVRAMEARMDEMFGRVKAALKKMETVRSMTALEFLVPY